MLFFCPRDKNMCRLKALTVLNSCANICNFLNRVMAAALSLTAGRGGGLIGNLSFGFLIDLNCVVPIVVFAAFLFSKYLTYILVFI